MASMGLSILCKRAATRSLQQIRSMAKARTCLLTSSHLFSTANTMLSTASGTRFSCSAYIPKEKRFELETYWIPVTAAVNMALDDAIPMWYPEKIHEAMRHSVFSPRKMPYPLMCIAACEMVGGSRDRALPLACALQMLHAASLAHHDLPCMDDVSIHKGQPANHKLFGEHVAILAGDALLSLAFEHMIGATKGVPVEKVLRAVYEISKVMGSKGMAGGQFVDLMSAGKEEADASVVEYIYLHKSAVMAECSLVGGAVVGGAPNEEVESLRKYGKNVGLMYQIMDDILDVSKSSQQHGNAAGKEEGAVKATYPKVFGIQRSRQIVEELKMNAKECLCGFDEERAAPLLSFADYAATRQC